jgi:hypothetical protein
MICKYCRLHYAAAVEVPNSHGTCQQCAKASRALGWLLGEPGSFEKFQQAAAAYHPSRATDRGLAETLGAWLYYIVREHLDSSEAGLVLFGQDLVTVDNFRIFLNGQDLGPLSQALAPLDQYLHTPRQPGRE